MISSDKASSKHLFHRVFFQYFCFILDVFFNCQPKVSPLVKLSIKSQCRGLQCSKISSYKWRLYQHFKRNTSFIWQRKHNLRLVTSTPLNSSDIVIKGGSLTGGNKYRLALFITITDVLRRMNAYDYSIAIPPTGGNCSISPPSGISLKTDFNLSCSNWESDNTPLSYQFQYRLENGLYSVLYRGVNKNISTSSIPPGNSTDNFTVKVIATVTDNFGISASPSLFGSSGKSLAIDLASSMKGCENVDLFWSLSVIE